MWKGYNNTHATGTEIRQGERVRERQSWSDCKGRRKKRLFFSAITLRAVQRDSRSNNAHSLPPIKRFLSEQSPSCPSLNHGLYNLRPGPPQELERVKVRPKPNMHAESAVCLHLSAQKTRFCRAPLGITHNCVCHFAFKSVCGTFLLEFSLTVMCLTHGVSC